MMQSDISEEIFIIRKYLSYYSKIPDLLTCYTSDGGGVHFSSLVAVPNSLRSTFSTGCRSGGEGRSQEREELEFNIVQSNF